MSVGLRLAADLPRRGVTQRKISPGVLFDDVMLAAWEASRAIDPIFERFLGQERAANELQVRLAPGPEPIAFEVDADRLVVSANTTAAGGAGYHAHVVAILDAVANAVGLEWTTDGENLFDETGYFEDRHFDSIVREMLVWFRGLAGVVLERESGGHYGLRLCLPMHVAPVGDWYVATPMGPMSRDDLVHVRDGDDAAIEAIARRFFPWWERGPTAHSLRGIALAECWTALRWVRPKNDAERQACRSVLALFERARALDPEIELPEPECGELRALLAERARRRPPRATGIGYRRGLMRHELTGNWSIEAPGYLDIEWDEGTWVGRSDTRTIYATTYSWTGPEDDDGGDFVDRFDGEPEGRRLTEMPEHLRAVLWPIASGDTEEIVKTRTRAAIGAEGTGCMLSIDSRLPDDGAFAESVARSAFVRGESS